MLARVIKTTSNDSPYGHSSDLYRNSYSTKSGVQWLGLGFGQTVQDTSMVWLKSLMFDWERLQFHESIQSHIRFFIPDSQLTYKQRRSQVSNITRLYNGVSEGEVRAVSGAH